jgi:hypothetical protein
MIMKNLNLGKIALLLALFTTIIFANVQLKVYKNVIYKGDLASFEITASGNDIKFPQIKEVGGYAILGVSNSSQTTIINGKVTKSLTKEYSFRPLDSVTIPSFKVEVDGKSYATKPATIKVIEPKASTKGDPFILEVSVNKKEVYVGEEIKLKVKFKYKINQQIKSLDISEPVIKDFWIKKADGVKRYNEGEYQVSEYEYVAFAQKSGKFKTPALIADVGVLDKTSRSLFSNDPFFNDPFFNRFAIGLKHIKVYSNSINLDIKPLPNNLEVYGEYNFDVKVDRVEVKANEPVNLLKDHNQPPIVLNLQNSL